MSLPLDVRLAEWWERTRRLWCRHVSGHDYVEGTCRRCEDTLW